MDITKAIEVLDALASGCSPITGEVIVGETILNEREVIRSLQIAIDYLRAKLPLNKGVIEITDDEILKMQNLFAEKSIKISENNFTGFFLGKKKFKDEDVIGNELYGKYNKVYSKGQLIDFFNLYLTENKSKTIEDFEYKKIDFFQKKVFNNLSENAIKQLKEKISKLGIIKTENLSEYVLNARKNYPRAYESWTDVEKELLLKALKYTNDLDLLSECFQRGKNSIESMGQKLIFESK